MTGGIRAEELAELITATYGFAERLRAEYEEAAADAGLTAAQATVLASLSEPASMSGLADRMGCDPSNITGIVDRLEAKGFVERATDAADRRVKRISPTPAGRAARRRFQEELVRVSSLATLGPAARRGLHTVLGSLNRR